MHFTFIILLKCDGKRLMISVVVPCYNCEKTVVYTLESLVNQEGSEYEIILVDDGSYDRTLEICQKYREKYTNIVVIHQNNEGLISAWKRGVREARGEYIIFCDSDDYVDSGYFSTINKLIDSFQPEMITYNLVCEYPNGDRNYISKLLDTGYYDRKAIELKIFPHLLFNGDMESELISKSRCNKTFKKSLLEKVIEYIPNEISIGEDYLTMFSCVINSNSIYNMRDYYPYHYVRNNQSMIGKYDEKAFEKLCDTYDSLSKICSQYEYNYLDEIKNEQFSTWLIYLKKEICRNPYGFRVTKSRLLKIRESERFNELLQFYDISGFGLKNKVFAILFINRCYLALFMLTKLCSKLDGKGV